MKRVPYAVKFARAALRGEHRHAWLFTVRRMGTRRAVALWSELGWTLQLGHIVRKKYSLWR